MLGKLPVPGRPTILITVGQGPTALAVGAGGGCLDIFTLIYPFSSLSPSLWETARYRLKYCLKGPLNPKQPTNLCFLHRLLNPLMSFPVYFYADYIFWSFGIVELILSYSDNRVLLKPVLWGVASVAHSITGCCIVVLRPW